MGQTTIEWTATIRPDGTSVPGYTFNAWWGCTKVSEGCTHCYADTLSTRYGFKVWGPKADRRFFGDKHWQEPLKWNRDAEKAGERRRVFCSSMADVFERHMLPNVQSQMTLARARLWDVIETTPMLDWLLLTKRPENIRGMVPVRWLHDVPANVWYGTSVENQEQADRRIPQLLQVPAVVRFLSCEPLLGPVDLTPWLYGEHQNGAEEYGRYGVSSGSDGRDRDRRGGADLEGSQSVRTGEDWGQPDLTLSSTQSGARSRGLPHGASDDRWEALPRSGPPLGVEAFQRDDPGRSNDQSQEWKEEREPPRQSGACDLFGAADSREASPESRSRSAWREERDGKVDRHPGVRDSVVTDARAGSAGDRGSVWGSVSDDQQDRSPGTSGISWCIAGGESGPGARPMHPDWARSLRDQCQAGGVAYHFKQWGEHTEVKRNGQGNWQLPDGSWFLDQLAASDAMPMVRVGKKAAGRLLDGRTWDEFPEVPV